MAPILLSPAEMAPILLNQPETDALTLGTSAMKVSAQLLPPKTIWTWWHDGEEALNPFLMACLESWRAHHPGWNVVVVSLKTLHQYVPEEDLPDTFHAIGRKSLQSDLVRVALLARHGGCYVDISSLALSDYAEDAWRRLHCGACFVGYRAPHFISDFVSAWCITVLPGNPVMAEWKAALKEVMTGRTDDIDSHKHPFFDGMDLKEYTCRLSKTGEPETCHGGSWADYLIVNVTLKAVLEKHPNLASDFWATAHLVSEADLTQTPTLWSWLYECPPGLHFPDSERFKMATLLKRDEAMEQSLAAVPMLKFFNSGSVFAHFTGAELLSSSSVIAGLVRRAAGVPALERLFPASSASASVLESLFPASSDVKPTVKLLSGRKGADAKTCFEENASETARTRRAGLTRRMRQA